MNDANHPHFDLSINLGQIITAVTIIVAIISAYFALNSRNEIEEIRITRNEEMIQRQQDQSKRMLDTLSAIQQDIAVIRYRLDGQQKQP
jgi:energy-converting hydrogenase Eha subunit H